MASRLLNRSKTLTLTLTRNLLPPSSPLKPIAASPSAQSLSSLCGLPPSDSRSAPSVPVHSPAVSSILNSQKILGCRKSFPFWSSVKTQGLPASQLYHSAAEKDASKTISRIEGEGAVDCDDHLKEKEVVCFSPLEAVATKPRTSILHNESLKIKRTEQSINITYALIPPLLLLAKTPLTTSLLIFSVYWQIYGFFKEIFLDYVHQEVTRKWVLVYFKVLLLILAKETIVNFGLF